MAAAKLRLLLSHSVRPPRPPGLRRLCSSSVAAAGPRRAPGRKKKGSAAASNNALLRVKRRTRSLSEFDREAYTNNLAEQRELQQHTGSGQEDGAGGEVAHVPVMLGEVLEVFSQARLRSFVDCTVGAAGHSSAIIRAHPELQLYVGLDLDPTALQMARTRIDDTIENRPCVSASGVEERRRPSAHLCHANFKSLRSILGSIDGGLLLAGGGRGSHVDGTIDGILMDLGMSSMQVNDPMRGFSVLGNGPLDMRMNPQATLKAEDILNSWPEAEVGRILREYGEESNWNVLQKKIANARACGGLHSTKELVDLLHSTSPKSRGRSGRIKTAIRVFQALRIAVNDELKTLEHALYGCFDCLSSGGRLAVISFHSLEDRIVKQTFLNIIDRGERTECGTEFGGHSNGRVSDSEMWSKRKIDGNNGIILTKRPVTPTEEEEKLNSRCRSAKLRVIQKI